MIKLVIPDIPPSNNKYMGRGSTRTQAFEYQNIKKHWADTIGWLVKKEKIDNAYKKAVVKITYYFPTKHRRDPDNYSGKFILDGLVRSGILVDDSFSNIELILKGDYDRSNPRTEIEIERVG
ncbi:RusA family crossover junction endodeoxyribonuclease [Alkaliphilus sp. B6464]|uniref:RusA family crossover junction endodeoxyribonuclease n=1 Tax=Alkaliphilus sp. B6464 TaxID=2731219 RepID=UPI001BA80721|nr:hypothetical protein [Alkaliphilus sp. B6464]QUH21439.1 hypothetical protein HYG84_17155 [Alkaliphilus sp. B6464]